MPDASRLAMAGLVLATLAPTPVTAAPEGRFEKSLSVSGPVTLSVTSGSGSIKVSSGADGTRQGDRHRPRKFGLGRRIR